MSNRTRVLNQANLISLGKISDQETIKVMQFGFRLNQERKIFLKEQYEKKETLYYLGEKDNKSSIKVFENLVSIKN